MGAIISFVLGLFGKIFGGWINAGREKAQAREDGKTEAANTLNETVAEIADEQAQSNAADRGDASAVARRLRERAKAGRGDKGKRQGGHSRRLPDADA